MRKTVLLLGSGIKASLIEDTYKVIDIIDKNNLNIWNWLNHIKGLQNININGILNNKRSLMGIQLFIEYGLYPLYPEEFWDKFKDKEKNNVLKTKSSREQFLNNYGEMIEDVYANISDIIINVIETPSSIIELPSLSKGENYKKTIIVAPNRFVSGKYILDGYLGIYIKSRNFSTGKNNVIAIPFNKVTLSNQDYLEGFISPDYYKGDFYNNGTLSLLADKHTYFNHCDIDPYIKNKIISIDPTLKVNKKANNKLKNVCFKNYRNIIFKDELNFEEVMNDVYNSKKIDWWSKNFYDPIESSAKIILKSGLHDYKGDDCNVTSLVIIVNYIYKFLPYKMSLYSIKKLNEKELKKADTFFFLSGRKIYNQSSFKKQHSKALLHFIEENYKLNLNHSHAYIKGKGIISACKPHSGSDHFLKVDISKYYDSIDQGILKRMIINKTDKNVWEKIIEIDPLQNDENGKKVGIKQGYTISPFLSNMYLSSFDVDVSMILKKINKNIKYTRYSDDILISSKNHFDKEKILATLQNELKKYKLELNNKKIKKTRTNIRYVGLTVSKYGVRLSRSDILKYKRLHKKYQAGIRMTERQAGQHSYYNYISNKLKIKLPNSVEKQSPKFVDDFIAFYNEFLKKITIEGEFNNKFFRTVNDIDANGTNVKVIFTRLKKTEHEMIICDKETYVNKVWMFIEVKDVSGNEHDKGYYIYPYINNKINNKSFKRRKMNEKFSYLMPLFEKSEELFKGSN